MRGAHGIGWGQGVVWQAVVFRDFPHQGRRGLPVGQFFAKIRVENRAGGIQRLKFVLDVQRFKNIFGKAHGQVGTVGIEGRAVALRGGEHIREGFQIMVTGATGYTLFYCNTEDGIYKEVPILYGSQTSYTLTDLVATGETTYVKVQANVLYNDVVEVGVMSDVATGVALPKKVTGLTVTAADANSLKLTWTLQQVAGNMADGYYVYSCDKSGHVIGRIADIESGDTNTYTDPDLTVGEYNYYVVCAYATSASGFMEGERSDPRGAIVLPTTPKNLALEVSGYNSITLTCAAEGPERKNHR